MEDILYVAFDKDMNGDEPGLCVSRKDENGEIYIVKMELGNQAEMLYRLLTNQDVKLGLPRKGEYMTKEEIIEQLENAILLIKQNGKDYMDARDIPILEAVIKSMHTEPCEDCISRQAVLAGLASIAKNKAKSDAQKAMMGRLMFFIEQLPSVQPEQKVGKWEHEEGVYGLAFCSNCEYELHTDDTNYCPNCGRRMMKEGE